MSNKEKIVLVFGTFDGLHDGHRFFLTEARKLGDRLIASVATDEIVERIKKQKPVHALAPRITALMKSGLVDEAISGDTELGGWSALGRCTPSVVAVGYDQLMLKERLSVYIQDHNLGTVIETIRAHEPDRFHSRLLRRK